MQDLIETVRAQAATVASTYTSDASARAAIQKKISEVQFSMPVSTAQSQKMIEAELDHALDSASKELANNDKTTNQDLVMAIVMTNLMRLGKSEWDDPGTVGDCEKHDPASVSDHAVSTIGTMRLSWPTLIDRQSAYGVIAHEFGHIVSSALTASKNSAFATVYKCVDTRQTGKNTKSTQEEDFADLFSSRVLANFESANAKTGNLACLLLREKNDPTRYGAASGLSMAWPANDEYVHSPSLYRLIQIELDRKHPLSQACGQLKSRFLPSMENECSM